MQLLASSLWFCGTSLTVQALLAALPLSSVQSLTFDSLCSQSPFALARMARVSPNLIKLNLLNCFGTRKLDSACSSWSAWGEYLLEAVANTCWGDCLHPRVGKLVHQPTWSGFLWVLAVWRERSAAAKAIVDCAGASRWGWGVHSCADWRIAFTLISTGVLQHLSTTNWETTRFKSRLLLITSQIVSSLHQKLQHTNTCRCYPVLLLDVLSQ